MIVNAQGLPSHCSEILLDIPIYINPVLLLLIYICTLLLDWILMESVWRSLGRGAQQSPQSTKLSLLSPSWPDA